MSKFKILMLAIFIIELTLIGISPASPQSFMSVLNFFQYSFNWIVNIINANSTFIGATATIVIAFFTGTLWKATSGMLKTASEQSKAMEKSINETTRAATAIEMVAKAIHGSARATSESAYATKLISINQENAIEMQMRAYLTVLFGVGIHQDREKNLKFGAMLRILNTGHTPAHKVNFKIKTDILPTPLPSNFTFPLLDEFTGESIVGPHQEVTMTCAVENFVDDKDVKNIQLINKGKSLYVWGIVNYIDVFKEKRETRFAQQIYWLLDEKTSQCLYIPHYNTAD